MAIDAKKLIKKMVSSKARESADMDNQWLEPASYDKKMVKAMTGDDGPEVFDQEDFEDDSFNAQDTVKKNTRAPLVKEDDEDDTLSENEWCEIRALELLEEILEVVDDISEDDESLPVWKDVVGNLQQVRDALVSSKVNEQLDESFKVGKNKLGDGSSVKLSKDDVDILKAAIANTQHKNALIKNITKSKADFDDFLTFARNLNEDFDNAIDILLSEATDEQLDYIAEHPLSEGENWNIIRNSTVIGARAASKAGAVLGGAMGGAYGAAIGTTLVAGRLAPKVWNAIKTTKNNIKRKREKSEGEKTYDRMIKQREIADGSRRGRSARQGPYLIHHNDNDNFPIREEDETILGTSAPAMDSDEKPKKKKRNLQELSKQTLTQYIKRASSEHNMANFAKRQTENVPGKEKEAKYWAHKEKNRKKGISRAIDRLEKE